jgi:hypothetical protein
LSVSGQQFTEKERNMNTNQIYLEKRLKVLFPNDKTPTGLGKNRTLVATINKNLEVLGYTLSPRLFRCLSHKTEPSITVFYTSTVPVLKKMRGAHQDFRPMYPNFPEQVIEASNLELYMNAICHYWSFACKDMGLLEETWLPEYVKVERMPLTETIKLELVDLGTQEDYENIFTALVEAKSSISESDKVILVDFVKAYGDTILRLLPEKIAMKEQLAFLSGLLLNHTKVAEEMVRYVKTPTDVLRIAAAFVGGDVSLAEATKFKKFSRAQRRFLLALLESCNTNLAEEMVKYQSRWIRLGEVLHPGEYQTKYPRTFAAFKALRSDVKIHTFNSKVEAALEDEDPKAAVDLLITRPGDFARRLDHILRMSEGNKAAFTKKFISVADSVSTTVLLQLFTHFKTRGESDFRAVFPKGNLAKIKVLETVPVAIDQRFCLNVAGKIRNVLVERFANLDKMGKVYLDPTLKTYLVPFSQRSATKALKTIVRGSQIPLDGDYDTVRFFVWWKNGKTRTDIDLSASLLNENFEYISDISYYNLKDFSGHHSGDITDAPKGAVEFIDLSLTKVLERGGRYIVMGLYSFTQQPYCDLPECFAGWMGRNAPQSGEIFEPKTVKNKFDIASDTQVVLPLIIDAKERKVVWMDLGLKQRPSFNNALNNSKNIGLVCKAMMELRKPNLYDLLSMHVAARGVLTTDARKADVVFSSETIPFDVDTILTKYV